MNTCHYHPNMQAIGQCKLCETNVCRDCLTIIRGNVLCPDCVAAASGNNRESERRSGTLSGSPQTHPETHFGTEFGRQSGTHSGTEFGTQFGNQNGSGSAYETRGNEYYTSRESKSKFLTFVLSFLPGLGHLYLGLTRQGIELMVLFFASTWLIPLLGPFPFSFVIPVLFFYGIFDALQKRDRLVRGEAIDANGTFFRDMNLEWFSDKKWLGWTIIGIGGLMLLKKMGAAGYLYRFNDLIVAMLLIGVGVWMLQKQRQGERVSRPNSVPIAEDNEMSAKPNREEGPPHA